MLCIARRLCGAQTTDFHAHSATHINLTMEEFFDDLINNDDVIAFNALWSCYNAAHAKELTEYWEDRENPQLTGVIREILNRIEDTYNHFEYTDRTGDLGDDVRGLDFRNKMNQMKPFIVAKIGFDCDKMDDHLVEVAGA